jgi:hypothetical protein
MLIWPASLTGAAAPAQAVGKKGSVLFSFQDHQNRHHKKQACFARGALGNSLLKLDASADETQKQQSLTSV